MTGLRALLDRGTQTGGAPGAVALVAHGPEIDVATSGFADAEGSAPMTRESIFRIASITKPIMAAAVLLLVDEGRLALDDSVARWLPELAAPTVVRTPQSPIDDVVPANRPITIEDLLSSRAGYGFPSNFSFPAVQPLFSELHQGSAAPEGVPPPDEWMARLARIPLLHQPGEAWLYNTCSEIQGVLVARASGRPLAEFLTERLFEPLQMSDTGFEVPLSERSRMTTLYRAGADGLELVDGPDGLWASPPSFPSGAGGLVSTVDDWLAFGTMLLSGGAAGGRQLLSNNAVTQMMTDQLTALQRERSVLFLEGQGWGYGGAVDVNRDEPWNTPGRYGWVGGSGTCAYVDPSRSTVSILLTQVEMNDPTAPLIMREFWEYAAGPQSR